MTIVLGIDPGSRVTGFGLLEVQGARIDYLTSGCIRTESAEMPVRLQRIYASLVELIDQYRPEQAAIEQVFMGQNVDSALKLGHARGAAMVACVNHALPVAEYSARTIKQSVVGHGAAEKKQVQHMVSQMLGLSRTPQADAADALAVAICHINSQKTLVRLAGVRGSRRGRWR